jgi:hypothetical protein
MSVSALYRRYVTAVCAHPRRAALVMLVLCIAPAVLTVRFFSDIRAGLQELLPSNAPSVRALDEIHARLGGQSHVTVIAGSPDRAENRRFIDALAARITARKLPEVRSLQGNVAAERAWARARVPLLLPRDRFDHLIDSIDGWIKAAKLKANPLYVDLDDEDHGKPNGLETLRKEAADADRFPGGYLEMPDGTLVVLVIWLEGSEVDMEPSSRLMAAIEAEVAALAPGFSPRLHVAYNGEVPNLLEEHDAILADLSLSTAIVVLLVGALIIAYFRSARGVAAVIGALFPGLLATFAIGRLTVHSINSNTAFLGSIIAGNGINYPLLLLAYYRARHKDAGSNEASNGAIVEAIVEAARRALPGTLGAAVTASAAYAGLAASSFQGFSQFGWLGGTGMVTTWIVTILAMPITIALFAPPRGDDRPGGTQRRLEAWFARRRAPELVAAGFVAVALAVAGIGVWRTAHRGLYEMNLEALRNRESLAYGSASWDARMNKLFGVWLNPVVCLVSEPEARERAAAELRRVLIEDKPKLADRIETIETFVPPEAEQAARLARLRALAATLRDLDREDIPADARADLDTWLGPDQLRPITPAEVPRTFTSALTEVSGRTDRTVLVYPSLAIDYNDGRNIIAFADRVATARLPEHSVTGGGFLFMAEIIRLIRDEALHVVLVVCALVGILLVPIFRQRPGRVIVTVATVAGVAGVAQAVMLALGVRINMLNFAAVPITIGVGADYVVNLFGAMRALDASARAACVKMGGAILLCSLTTIVGYLSLVFAQSGALRSFGWAAVLGEVMAITTVLVVLPVALRSR